jgi:hypothetical protein
MEPSEHLVREFTLKSKLSIFCNRKLKEYARQKVEKNKGNERLIAMLESFIREKVMTYRYSIFLTILFSREFQEIRSRVLSGKFSLAHISHEDYWAQHGSNIGLAEAIFFSYTFYSEAYPVGEEVINDLLKMIEKEPNIDIKSAIDELTAEKP